MPGLVGGFEGFLEPAQPGSIEPQSVGGLVEAGALLEGDDAVFDDLGEDLLVVSLELAELQLTGDLALAKPLLVLERESVRHVAKVPHPAQGPSLGGPCVDVGRLSPGALVARRLGRRAAGGRAQGLPNNSHLFGSAGRSPRAVSSKTRPKFHGHDLR